MESRLSQLNFVTAVALSDRVPQPYLMNPEWEIKKRQIKNEPLDEDAYQHFGSTKHTLENNRPKVPKSDLDSVKKTRPFCKADSGAQWTRRFLGRD